MILDTFYLLFKSDSAQATKDVGELDKKVNTLRETGKKQSEQQQKDTKESTKQHKEFNDSLKETGYQYTKIAESLAQATVAAVSFGSIAKGIFGTAASNSNLQVQSKLLGQSVVDIKAYGAAVEAAGGNPEAFGNHFQALFERFSELGLNLPKIDEVIQKYRQVLKQAGNNPAQQELAFQRLNITDPGFKSLLLKSDEQFDDAIARQKDFAKNTEDAADNARQFADEWRTTGSALDSVFTAIGQDVLPIFITINKDLQEFFGYLKDNKGIAEVVFGGAATAVTIFSSAIIGTLIPALAAMGATAAAAFAPLAVIGLGTAGIAAAYKWSSSHGFNAGSGGADVSAQGSLQSQSDPLAAQKKALGIPAYPPEIEDQLRLGQISRAQRDLSFANQMPIGASNIAVGGGGRNISVKTGDIHVYSAASDASGIAGDVSSELERHINLAISNMDDGVAR